MNIKKQYGHFINGEYVAPNSGEYIDSVNPADQSLVTQIARGNSVDVDTAIAAAKEAASAWAAMRPLDRGRILIDVGRKLRENAARLGELETLEMGAPVALSTITLNTAAEYFEYFGSIAPTLQGETIPVGPNKHSYTTYEPFGVVGTITPWNAPLNQAARSVSPALAAGNVVVHKPSEHTSLTTLVFAQLAVEAGLPPGVWNVVTGYGVEAGEPLVRHRDVRKVGFTGSVPTGQRIGAMAAQKIMPVTLELGGKSPSIVFEDADLKTTIPGVILGLAGNTGQICLAGTRILDVGE